MCVGFLINPLAMWFGRPNLALLVALFAIPAQAEEASAHGVRLSFVRAENASGCIPLTALEREITRRMGRDPFVGSPRQWIEGVATRKGNYYEIQLFERDAAGRTVGSRRLGEATADCRKLDDAIELAVALIIDPAARLAPFVAPETSAGATGTPGLQAPTSAPGPSDTPQASASLTRAAAPTLPNPNIRDESALPKGTATPVSETQPHDAQSDRSAMNPAPPNAASLPATTRQLNAKPGQGDETQRQPNAAREHTDASTSRAVPSETTPVARDGTNQQNSRDSHTTFTTADAVLVSGVLPNPAFGVELGVRVGLERTQRWSLRLATLFLPEQRDTSGGGDFSYGLTALELGACINTHAQRLVGFGCVSPGMGAVHAVVNSPEPFEPGDRLWFAVRLEAGLALQVAGPVWLEARAFDLVAPLRWQFRVKTDRGPQEVFRQDAFMPGGALGLGVKFD